MDGIRLHVNGKIFDVRVDSDTPLIYVLRNDLGLKGTRARCLEGQCMCCTVLIDGRPQTACTVPIGSVANQSVETVESLTAERGNHPLINSILKEQAGQCGYGLSRRLMMYAMRSSRSWPVTTRLGIEACGV